MSTLPEPTKMNWSTVKPSFEEVEGKDVIVEFQNKYGRPLATCKPVNKDFWGRYMNDADFLRYAIIDTEPEPLEYKGKLPSSREDRAKFYVFWVADDTGEEYWTSQFDTKAEAIEAWNKFVKAMEEK